MEYFPTCRYHKEQGSKLFHSDKELREAGPGWADTPARIETGPFYPESDAARIGVEPNTQDDPGTPQPAPETTATSPDTTTGDDIQTPPSEQEPIVTPRTPIMGAGDLENKTVPELKMLASQAVPPIRGWQRMNKTTLIAKLSGER